MDRICDIHSHILYDIDDGATDLDMSIEMLQAAYQQGVRDIFCTSHDFGELDKYNINFKQLVRRVNEEDININLHIGCEIFCDTNYIKEIVKELNEKELLTMNDTKYVLTEFSSHTNKDEILYCVKTLQDNGWKVIIAHAERYKCLFNDINLAKKLIAIGCFIQVNAYSLQAETNKEIKKTARSLLKNKLVTFIGSDAHRSNHRTYNIQNGIEYIYKHCDSKYAKNVCYKNAEKVLLNKK